MVEEIQDPRRVRPDYVLGEREMLERWLEWHRTTLLIKCEGLDDADRRARPIPTSLLNLHGLVRHMAEVERGWFQYVLASRPRDMIWCSEEQPDADLEPTAEDRWEDDLAIWERECETSRAIASARTLDDTGLRRGEPCSLRWIYLHMIEEYARHNGHADLLRELVDGAVGD